FFQAEDGIRDFHVTGVQTCALPISFFDIEGDVPTVDSERPTLVGPRYTAALAGYVEDAREALDGAPAALDYIADRFGIDPAMARALRLGYAGPDAAPNPFPYLSRGFQAFPRVTVPLLDFDGAPQGLQGRDISGDCP